MVTITVDFKNLKKLLPAWKATKKAFHFGRALDRMQWFNIKFSHILRQKCLVLMVRLSSEVVGRTYDAKKIDLPCLKRQKARLSFEVRLKLEEY